MAVADEAGGELCPSSILLVPSPFVTEVSPTARRLRPHTVGMRAGTSRASRSEADRRERG